MAERRPLSTAISQFTGADPAEVHAFVTQEKPVPATVVASSNASLTAEAAKKENLAVEKKQPAVPVSKYSKKSVSGLQIIGLVPVTIRFRPELAVALKRASLKRQLEGEELFTQKDIVEEALEPWLQEHGYL